MQGTHHNDKDSRACEAPDEGFVDRDPAEVRVPIALGIQADSKAWVGTGRKGCVLELLSLPCVERSQGGEHSRLLAEQVAWEPEVGVMIRTGDRGRGQATGWTGVRGHSLDGPASRALTQQHSRDAPAQGMVEAHGAAVHIAWLDLHAVEVQPLHEEPREGAEEEVVQEDGDRGAHQLKAGEGVRISPALPASDPPQASASHLLPLYPAPHPGPNWSAPDL